jgi:hypothetical protein
VNVPHSEGGVHRLGFLDFLSPRHAPWSKAVGPSSEVAGLMGVSFWAVLGVSLFLVGLPIVLV